MTAHHLEVARRHGLTRSQTLLKQSRRSTIRLSHLPLADLVILNEEQARIGASDFSAPPL